MDGGRDGRRVRQPVVAGSFYPGAAPALGRDVDRLLGAVMPVDDEWPALERTLRGVIVPHAGYAYSGPVAATAYALLAARHVRPARIVLLGPSHFAPLRGMAVPSDDAWLTPLGEVPIDDDARRAALRAGAITDDEPHRSEHSLEVQLPFIQRVLPGVPVLPIAVGHGAPSVDAELLRATVAEEDLLIISTDLSHYHDADTARRLDARTAAAITALEYGAIGPDDACGHDPLRAALAWASSKGLDARRLDLRNSGDTAGGTNRVVGYGAFALERTDAAGRPAAAAP